MGKRFRNDLLDQALLLPPSLHDWLPEGHLARFIADVIQNWIAVRSTRLMLAIGGAWLPISRR